MERAILTASASASTGPSLPGTVVTWALRTVSLATDLSPISLIDFDLGPMNLMLHDSHCSANFAFSERKPYPGWIASTSAISAALMIRSARR